MNIVRRQARGTFSSTEKWRIPAEASSHAKTEGGKTTKPEQSFWPKKKKQNAAYRNSHYSFFSTVKTPARFWVPKPFSSCSTWLFLTGSVCDPCNHVRQRKLLPFLLRSEKCLFCSQEKLSAWIGEKRRKQEFLEISNSHLNIYMQHISMHVRLAESSLLTACEFSLTESPSQKKNKNQRVIVQEWWWWRKSKNGGKSPFRVCPYVRISGDQPA